MAPQHRILQWNSGFDLHMQKLSSHSNRLKPEMHLLGAVLRNTHSENCENFWKNIHGVSIASTLSFIKHLRVQSLYVCRQKQYQNSSFYISEIKYSLRDNFGFIDHYYHSFIIIAYFEKLKNLNYNEL